MTNAHVSTVEKVKHFNAHVENTFLTLTLMIINEYLETRQNENYKHLVLKLQPFLLEHRNKMLIHAKTFECR